MRNDLKIKALRNKFGLDGYAVWCMILEVLTDRDDFEYEWNDLSAELMSADFGIDAGKLRETIEYCIKLNLLELSEGKIFSQKHKDRFDSLLTKRQRDRNRFIVSDNPIQSQVSVSDNPHSKVKYSKVKESIVKYSKEDNNSKSIEDKSSAAEAATLKRGDEFYKILLAFVPTYGKDMLRSFFDYWSEMNKSKTKMRFEIEKTWNLAGRLRTWERNEKKFNKGSQIQQKTTIKDVLSIAGNTMPNKLIQQS